MLPTTPRAIAFVTACAVVLAGCEACTSPVDQPGSTIPGRCGLEAPAIEPQKTDILFVIDNSGSMAEEQDGIAVQLPLFIDELKRGGGVAQDFNVAVMTTAVYQNALIGGTINYFEYGSQSGRLQPVPVPSADGGFEPGPERMLVGTDPLLAEKFGRLVRQGTAGSGQETPFEALRLALAGPLSTEPVQNGGTVGFLRDGARLLIVMVTDEDDCSEDVRPPKVTVGTQTGRNYCGEQSNNLTPVSTYFQMLKDLKDSTGAPRDVIYASIAPVARSDKRAESFNDNGTIRNVDCPTSFQPGVRHREMAVLFDAQAQNLDSICNADYQATLVNIAALANVDQSLEVRGVPDPGVLQILVTRKDGNVQTCTTGNQGIEVSPAEGDRPATVLFQASCLRRADDLNVSVRMLCAG